MKFKLFVSGNQTELKEERFAVKEVITNNHILNNHFDVFLFEDLPAKGEDPVSTYIDEVEKSDIYIGLIGNVYGEPNDAGLSPTELEFQTFINTNPHNERLIFIKGKSDANREDKTQKFIQNIKNLATYKRFDGLDDLKSYVEDSLTLYLYDKHIIRSEPFDMAVCFDAGYDDINEDSVKDFLEKRATELNLGVPSRPVKDFLVDILKVVKEVDGEFKPTNTGLLFFGKDPAEFIPQSEIKMVRFNGVTRLQTIDSKEISGRIYEMLDEAEIFFKRNTRLANKIVGFKRVDIPEYPYEAVREALINAIAHRDYDRDESSIMFSIFDDRVEISNPGGLLPGLNIRKLEGKHATRNKKICSIFKETMYMERYGTGIIKMKNLMGKHGLEEPEFEEEGDFFVVRFYGPGENILDLVNDIPDEQMTDLKELGLNDRQIEALKMMVNENITFTNSLYQKTFNLERRTASRDLKKLLDLKQIRRIGSGRATKYKAS
ncbi:MAG: ATP-binding protein [Methanobacterium sp.]|jgi:predicted HTH transcriptional regulator